jgi:hypothetical protein
VSLYESAFHEAGHAVVLLYYGIDITSVALPETGPQSGRTEWLSTGLDPIVEAVVAVAGIAAERLLFGDPGADVVRGDMALLAGSGIDPNAALRQATAIIDRNWSRVEEIAQALLCHPQRRLGANDIARLIGG